MSVLQTLELTQQLRGKLRKDHISSVLKGYKPRLKKKHKVVLMPPLRTNFHHELIHITAALLV